MLKGEFAVWAGDHKAMLKVDESFFIPSNPIHVVAVLNDESGRMLAVAVPSGLDMALFERISAEIGDEILGIPGDLPAAT